jgi:hypothetical protein
MRKSVLKFLAAGLAAASLTAVAAPTYAGTVDESATQSAQGWCDIVPPFCGCQGGGNARCRPGPCTVKAVGDRARNDQGICAAKTED